MRKLRLPILAAVLTAATLAPVGHAFSRPLCFAHCLPPTPTQICWEGADCVTTCCDITFLGGDCSCPFD
jgi:hypothetical protein